MQKQLTIKLLPSEAANDTIIRSYIASHCGVPEKTISGFHFLKRSLDARGKQVWVLLTLLALIDEPYFPPEFATLLFNDVSKAKNRVLIVGAGPAGLFAAIKLIEQGIKPVLVERGKDVRSRRRDLARISREGVINPESNYCFGEGGAGTYSDGKLYTRSSKRGDIARILNILVQFGADPSIAYDAHPHIGTNKLPAIITAIRQQILDCGGTILFEKKMTDLIVSNNVVTGIKTSDGAVFEAEAVILATGHSARDVFQLLYHKKILIESKPFALGVRIEHPQQLIDSIQYHCPVRSEYLPPASYSLVQQIEGKGVFSFCMCPGGIIAPAATSPGEIVVNGWSPSKRNNPYANSGMVVSVEEKELVHLQKQWGPLAAMHFQQSVEQKAFTYGGGKLVAPAQRMTDFTEKKISSSLPGCSYLPGIHSVSLHEVLPAFIFQSLAQGFRQFGKKMKGYYTNEAVIVATESRTSSPVRIPRDPVTLQHPQVKNLYPCGEGAGYAGGIVSAAMDGERVAKAIAESLGVGEG
ncbi:MAG: FAD-binding protein [Chitinophagaceae bacterium]|nr:FAD-binding protein [Chitinophagaceae bacterium]